MDSRDERLPKWLEHDFKNMCFWIRDYWEEGYAINVRDVRIPTVYEVCHVCQGKGQHVNPDIDRNGIVPDDFNADPDLFDQYMSGVYDIGCRWCKGRRVEMVVDEKLAKKEDTEIYHEMMRNYWGTMQEQEAERLAGC
jgi:hypothetical protein